MITLSTLPEKPGVYRFLNREGEILYIGKAINLKKRVSSYFQRDHVDPKLSELVRQIHDLDLILTQTGSEALVLEAQQIRQIKPKYNIVFQDDKSYPYFALSGHPNYPRLSLTRNRTIAGAEYFGPVTDVKTMRIVLMLLQKKFQLRHCSDRFLNSRTRPCLQYQIQRCSAPCVNLVSKNQYIEQVQACREILQGGPALSEWIQKLESQMTQFSEVQDYEQAALMRDQVIAFQNLKQQTGGILQISSSETSLVLENFDGIGVYASELDLLIGLYWIQVRGHQLMTQEKIVMVGADLLLESTLESDDLVLQSDHVVRLLDSFLSQRYVQASELKNSQIANANIFLCNLKLSAAIQKQFQKKLKIIRSQSSKVAIQWIFTGDRSEVNYSKWHDFLSRGAHQAILAETTQSAYYRAGLLDLQTSFKLFSKPSRIECFDISHTSGLQTIGGCVVFDEQGFRYSDYRRFKIKALNHIPGDDYAALSESVTRRYLNIQNLPDILLIDGGKGQLSAVISALQELQLESLDVLIVGLSKGPERRSGFEKIYRAFLDINTEKLQYQEIKLALKSPGFLLLQRIRDEAHRYAISGHRKKRNQVALQSILESIPGIGPQKRKRLLAYFGGYQEIAQATVLELECVTGITEKLAKKIVQILQMH